MKVLRARLYEMELRKQQEAIAKDRRSQVGTGERSEKIRTYNFKDNRITDHRVNFTTPPARRRAERRPHRTARQRHHPLSVREAEGRDGGLVTIHGRVGAARQRLRDAGISANEADLDARLLAQHVLGWTTERLPRRRAIARARRLRRAATMRWSRAAPPASRSPTSSARGEFWGLRFRSVAGRAHSAAETELIVESGARSVSRSACRADDRRRRAPAAAASPSRSRTSVPRRRVVATDISDAALRRRRAATPARHGVADRIAFRHADLLDASTARVSTDRRQPAVRPRRRRPGAAARGPRSRAGGGALRRRRRPRPCSSRLVAQAPARLRRGGCLIFEFGFGQDVEIEAVDRGGAANWTWSTLRRDLAGHRAHGVARRM